MLTQSNISKLDNSLKRIKKDVYSEPPTNLHSSITMEMIDYFLNKYPIRADSKILDVGCGQGVALEIFENKGYYPIGITLDDDDYTMCKQKNYHVFQMDQSFLDFGDEEFHFIWCRHCLEHSVFPYITLLEMYRVLKQGGYLYIEVPAPETSCHHEKNSNHYSVLGKNMWIELIKRSEFERLEV